MKSVEVFSLGTRLMLKGSKELKNTLSRLVMKESWFLRKPISRHVLVISDKITSRSSHRAHSNILYTRGNSLQAAFPTKVETQTPRLCRKDLCLKLFLKESPNLIRFTCCLGQVAPASLCVHRQCLLTKTKMKKLTEKLREQYMRLL